MDNVTDIKQDMRDALQQTLLKEYELTFTRLEGLSNRTFQFLLIALAILGFLTGYVLQPNVPVLAAWLIPLFCLTMYTLPIFFTYSVLACFWNARILSRRINAILPETALIHLDRNSPESAFFSTRRGNSKIRLMYIILFGGSALLFPPIGYISLSIVYERQSHLAGSLFILVYG